MPKVNKNPIPLARLRKAQGLSRWQFAEKIGVGDRAVESWEQRRVSMSDVPAGKVLAAAKVLGCTMEELLED